MLFTHLLQSPGSSRVLSVDINLNMPPADRYNSHYYMKRYFISLAALVLIISIIIAWSHYTRYRQFHDYHSIIAEHSTQAVASSINDMIEQRERLIRVFVNHHREIIEQIIRQPDAQASLDYLSEEIAEYFPNYFTFTITDVEGRLLLEDIESLVGTVCLQDLKEYMHSGMQRQRVHPSPHGYHFDVVTPFRAHNKTYMFFVSFHTSLLGKILSAAQGHDHRLYLAMPTDEGGMLLEALASGARDTEIRDSYILTEEEQNRTLSSRSIDNTRWIVIDSYTDELYSSFIAGLVTDSAVYLGSFIIVISILSLYLLRAERRKRIAEKHKDEFLSIISHELRTPLTAINGSLSLLNNLKDDNAERRVSLLQMAISNTSKLTSLVNDILDLQKMEAGKMQYHMMSIHLHELLEDAIRDIASYASETGAQIESRYLNEDPIIIGDKSRLMQVMYNLISNAIKYGAKNDTILVTTNRVDNNHIRVAIIDHGQGIPERFKHRLFEKFTQADSSASRKFTGTGLGLSIVKSIIEEHHGSVGFYSDTGSGSTFYFDLPWGTETTH
jgi:signal transduction histidine kinase